MAKKILIVDDEKDIVEFFGLILGREGFQVSTATNGKDCLRLAAAERPDLILLDINMPEMDGGDVTRNLSDNEKTRKIPVVFLSGMLTQDEEREVKGHLFISKFSATEEIIQKIRKILYAPS